MASFEDVYGAENLKPQSTDGSEGVRIITAAPEVEGVMDSIDPLAQRGVIFSVGHRCELFSDDMKSLFMDLTHSHRFFPYQLFSIVSLLFSLSAPPHSITHVAHI